MTNVRTNFQETSDNGYLEARSNYLTIFMNRAYSWLKRIDAYFSYTREHQIQQKCVEVLKKFSQFLLDTRRESRKKQQALGTDDELNKTVLDLFLDAGVPEHILRDHIDTFIVAVRAIKSMCASI